VDRVSRTSSVMETRSFAWQPGKIGSARARVAGPAGAKGKLLAIELTATLQQNVDQQPCFRGRLAFTSASAPPESGLRVHDPNLRKTLLG